MLSRGDEVICIDVSPKSSWGANGPKPATEGPYGIELNAKYTVSGTHTFTYEGTLYEFVWLNEVEIPQISNFIAPGKPIPFWAQRFKKVMKVSQEDDVALFEPLLTTSTTKESVVA